MKHLKIATPTPTAKLAAARSAARTTAKVVAENAASKNAHNPVEEYLAAVPEPAHTTLQKLRATIRSGVPADATEVISYGMPSFRCQGMGIVVWYAAFTQHCSLFPTAEVMDQFRSELTHYQTSKGTIQFSLAKPLPVPLVKKIVKARMASLERKKKR